MAIKPEDVAGAVVFAVAGIAALAVLLCAIAVFVFFGSIIVSVFFAPFIG